MYKIFFKRIIDIFLSLIAIILLSPLFIPICIGLLLTGEHYVFYKQKRVGYKNKEFYIFKFATMLKDSPNIGTGIYTAKNDPRILPLGGFLRKTKINEFPQLINVLFGDMSIIGPRPLLLKTYNLYSKLERNLIGRVKPGISGVQQIIFRNEDEMLSNTNIPLDIFYKKNIAPYKGKLESWYVKNISLYTDIMLILLTIMVVINRKNKIVYKIFRDIPNN
tara:strand:+ start:25 stop:684 length:660 start_codon:yes stop_codon:yes gene_type:complete